jgi:threonine dehydratase
VSVSDVVVRPGVRYINGYDDPEIVAGAGTIGIEVLEQVSKVDAVIVPVGGAGNQFSDTRGAAPGTEECRRVG